MDVSRQKAAEGSGEPAGKGRRDRAVPEKAGGSVRRRAAAGAAAFALDPLPDLLLLDEPVSAVDRKASAFFYDLVTSLRSEYHMPVILVSHDLGHVKKYASKAAFLQDGTVAMQNAVDKVLNNPQVREAFGWIKGGAMDGIYSFLNLLLPFEWAEFDFMKNALLAVLMITPLFGLTGTMIVNNKMSFFSDALGHSALTGIAIGVMMGIDNYLISMLGFALLFAVAISGVMSSQTSSSDTIIGVFSATGVALGVVLLSANGGFSKYSNYLIGDILAVSLMSFYCCCLSF